MMKVVIIGGVAAGMSAAAKLKRNMGDRAGIVVLEKGGVVSYAACGIPFYVSDKIKESAALIERTPEQFAESGIDVRLWHEVEAVDIPAKKVRGRNIHNGESFEFGYDKLIVASGARVRTIPPLDTPRDNLCVVRDVDDGIRLKERVTDPETRQVVVVGAGFIGLEIADACARHGRNVVVVEFAERILPVMDPEITDRLAAEMRRHKVDVRVDSKVSRLNCSGNRIQSAVLENADGEQTIPADLVVNCAGIIPNAEFIDVQKALNGAILVNDRMETSAIDVYAAGDCSVMESFITREHQYSPLGTNANKQGRMIAELLAGKGVPPLKLIGASALRLFDLDAAKVGLSEIDAQKLNLDYKTSLITGNDQASYYGPGKITVKLVYDAKSRKILGAQAIGSGVVAARANYYAIAISAGMTVDEFGYLDLCYSPPFSGVWDATLIAANTAK